MFVFDTVDRVRVDFGTGANGVWSPANGTTLPDGFVMNASGITLPATMYFQGAVTIRCTGVVTCAAGGSQLIGDGRGYIGGNGAQAVASTNNGENGFGPYPGIGGECVPTSGGAFGGGGAGGFAPGGAGGTTTSSRTSPRTPPQGQGGPGGRAVRALPIVPGSGGGGGGDSEWNAFGAPGGHGGQGGAALYFAAFTVSGNLTIMANGGVGANAPATPYSNVGGGPGPGGVPAGSAAGGGGGAGGQIYVVFGFVQGQLVAQARGGRGGDGWWAINDQGPGAGGGGGGGGGIHIRTGGASSPFSVDVAGGAGGARGQNGNATATDGAAGGQGLGEFLGSLIRIGGALLSS